MSAIFAVISSGTLLYLGQITAWNKKRIQNNEIQKLPEFKTIDKNKYDAIAANLPKNEREQNYYIEIIVNVQQNDAGILLMSLKEYTQYKNAPEIKDLAIASTEYNVVHYKILTNSWRYTWKKYFKKSFTLIFNNQNELIEKYSWENKI